ncbi:MAG: hypothetical protein GX622_08415 [Bacteroidales bacterium]|nr:hypothetical protein [Bacteroidales bacterium]
MTRFHTIAPVTAAIALIISISSCSVQPCYEDTDPLMITEMLVSGTGETAKADSLRVYTYRTTDTLKFVSQKGVSRFSVPLDPGSDESLFLITLNGVTDTAIIRYERHPHLVSPECGYTLISEITGLYTTHNIIDTLIIENPSVDLDGQKNLHLFY